MFQLISVLLKLLILGFQKANYYWIFCEIILELRDKFIGADILVATYIRKKKVHKIKFVQKLIKAISILLTKRNMCCLL